MNPAKRYLSQIQLLDLKISQLIEERDSLRSLASGSGSLSINPMRVQTSSPGSMMSNCVDKYVDLERVIEDMVDRYVNDRHRVIEEIQSLKNPNHIRLLFLRYVEFRKLDEIAKIMGYSEVHIRRMHGNALDEFSQFMGFAGHKGIDAQ